MINSSIHQEDIIILNVHVPSNRTSKNRKQKLIEMREKMSQFIIADFNISLSIIDRTRRQKISKVYKT